MKSWVTNHLTQFFLEYETPRQVRVLDKRVGVICRLIQFGVLLYIIGWVFIYEKGYQTEDTAISAIYVKMKGVGYTKMKGRDRVWDEADYVFPAQGGSSFVVMTNYIRTEGQTQGKCSELPGSDVCSSDSDCEAGTFTRNGHGHKTGRCVMETHTCEVSTWCPIEDDRIIPDPPLLLSAENYTLFIKNSILFPMFNVKRSNLVEAVDQKYLKTCVYDVNTHPLCPIFRFKDIIQYSGFDFLQLSREGGAIGVLIDWVCNLDLALTHCVPNYSFHGLYGDPDKNKPSVGYNFRHARYYMEDSVEKRTLLKVFGIRIDVNVHGLARKFDIIPTMTAIGSGVGIFGVATVVCDLMLLYILPKRELYKNMKFKYSEVKDEEAVFKMNQSRELSEDK